MPTYLSSHDPLPFSYKIALWTHAFFVRTPFFVTLQPWYNTVVPTSRAFWSSSFGAVHIAVSRMMIVDDLGTAAEWCEILWGGASLSLVSLSPKIINVIAQPRLLYVYMYVQCVYVCVWCVCVYYVCSKHILLYYIVFMYIYR